MPGGRIGVDQLVGLARSAAAHGQHEIQLTSRANLQLRGIDGDRLAELTDQVAALGLLPSPDHERVRNIVAAPLAGIGRRLPLAALIKELDTALCAEPSLAELPGRFLFLLDDDGGDLAGQRCDVGLRLLDRHRALIMVNSAAGPLGRVLPIQDAVPAMITIALRFVAARRTPRPVGWHLWESDPAVLDEQLRPLATLGPDVAGALPGGSGRRTDTPRSGVPIGVGEVDGAASVLVPLARLGGDQVAAIARACERSGADPVLTPWRGVVIPGGAPSLPQLAAAGLIVDQDDPWNGLTACVGAPGCARSLVDTRRLASELVGHLAADGSHGPIHLSGCERRCGLPAGEVLDLVAPRDAGAALAAVRRRTAPDPAAVMPASGAHDQQRG